MGKEEKAVRKSRRPWLLVALAVVLAGVLVWTRLAGGDSAEAVPLTDLKATVAAGEVKEATLDDGTRTISVVLDDGTKESSGYPAAYGSELLELLETNDVEVEVAPLDLGYSFSDIIIVLLPVVLILAFFVLMMRGRGGLGGLGIGKLGKGRGAPVEVPVTRFTDVAGADEVVSELAEVVEFLKEPERFTSSGARMPRGFLLAGPPGTGKTLLARAVAGEAGVPFFALSGSDFVETFVGVGAGRVRDLFEKAKEQGKAIIFIDEIDAVGKARTSGVQTGANEERENTLNALLTEMDGFAQTSGIIMLAATNRADILDPALTRPGRFDRKIVVPAPDRHGRAQILALHAKHLNLRDDVDFSAMARRTHGMTGADITGLINEAALESARDRSPSVGAVHFEAALQTTMLGRARRSALVSERDQEIVAWHEAGHTVAALVHPHAFDPVTVTIIPRGPTGGATWMGGNEHDFTTRSQDLAQLVVAMGGRAAEEVLLGGDFTGGASGDLSSATARAHEMVARYGMGQALVSLDPERMSSEDLARINDEVSSMLKLALTEARGLLEEHGDLLRAVAHALVEDETLNLEELRAIEAQVRGRAAGTPGVSAS